MQPKRTLGIVAGVLLASALTACNLARASQPTPDVNALYTEAAATLVSQLNDQQTQTAAAAPPTSEASPTPLATFAALPTLPAGLTPIGTFTFSTPGAGLPTIPPPIPQGTGVYSFPVGCNDAMFIGETVPDKTQIEPQTQFKKAWSLQNTGTCTWDKGYVFAFKSGDQLQGENQPIINEDQYTEPGHSQAFVVHLMTPKQPGEYIGSWQMQDDKGTWFGSVVTVDVIVP